MEEKLSIENLKYLKHVSFNLDMIDFNRLENFIKNYFRHVDILRLTTKYDPAYLDAQRWEKLIVSYMPNLRIFDFNHHESIRDDDGMTFHDLIKQFNSTFWIERQWFFTHQHDWQERFDRGIMHSTDPYRRKDYKFYWGTGEQKCPHVQETNLNLVKYVLIDTRQATKNSTHYFPNTTELTIKYFFKTPDHSISTTLNLIEDLFFPCDEIIKLLSFTPSLHTFKFDYLSIRDFNPKLIKESDTFQSISTTNQIKNLEIRITHSLQDIQLIVNLFPRLEYQKIGIDKQEMNQIVRYLLSKTNKKTGHLFFLCILEIPKRCLKELNVLIQSENLIKNYAIKFINRDLYIWW